MDEDPTSSRPGRNGPSDPAPPPLAGGPERAVDPSGGADRRPSGVADGIGAAGVDPSDGLDPDPSGAGDALPAAVADPSGRADRAAGLGAAVDPSDGAARDPAGAGEPLPTPVGRSDRADLTHPDPVGPSGPAEPPDDPGRAIGRRAVLGLLGLGAVGVLLGSRAQTVIDAALRPVQLRDGTGLSSYVPGSGRFRIYSVVGYSPTRTTDEYRLTVDGLVDEPLDLSFDDLVSGLPQTSMTKDFQCVTGWRVEDVDWSGVLVRELLDRAGVKAEATHLRIYSFDGAYTETLTLDQARRDDVLVAHSMLGAPVTKDHGGPVRLYVAPMYGYKSLKWLERIELVVGEDPVGYWENRGYDVEAWIGRSNGRDDAPVE